MNPRRLAYSITLACLFASQLNVASLVWAQSGTLAEPFAPPSPNAALHYQRALLYLAAIEREETKPLEDPVWEVMPEFGKDAFSDDLKALLYKGRLAARSASSGARLEQCDFGIDFRDHGAATPLPHAEPMLRLGRLLTLRGAYEQARGRWEDAAVIYLDGLRVGRHMTHQHTVVESLAGMQILNNNYYALCRWAVDCPEPKMVGRAFGLLEAVSDDLIAPARTVAAESSILSRRLVGLRAAFPEGPWAELILEDLGEEIPAGDLAAVRRAAVAACVARGVPREVFNSEAAFRKHLTRIRDVNLRFTEAAAACMKLPPLARARRGQEIYETYTKLAGALGDDLALDPSELGRVYAVHEADLTLTRVALAVGAARSKSGFPESLDAVAAAFGGRAPASPYDGSPLAYEVNRGGKGFSLRVQEIRGGEVTLPEVAFHSVPPAEPAQ